jgi:hypothetical protein
VRLLKGGHSIHNAAKIAGKGVSTVWRVKPGVESVAARPFYIRSRFHSRPRQNPDALLHGYVPK